MPAHHHLIRIITNSTTFSVDAFRVARSLMRLKKSSNSIGPCDRLLQEPITFPRKISRTLHESYQSNTAIGTILAAQLLMCLKKSSNLIGSFYRLLQESITFLYPRFEKVGGILVYICPWFRPSFRPSLPNSVTLFRQRYLHNRLR